MVNTTTLNETLRDPIDGTEYVRLATPGANWKVQLSSIRRTILTADLQLYQDSTLGSDSYNGLSPTFTGGTTGPTYTIQHAIDLAANNYDFANLYGLTISCADGNIPDTGFILCPLLLGLSGAQSLGGGSILPQFAQIFGNLNTPDNVVCAACFSLAVAATYDIEGFQMTGSDAAFSTQPASVVTINNIDFAGSFAGIGAALSGGGGIINGFQGTFTISSNMPRFCYESGGIVTSAVFDFDEAFITFNNNPHFSVAFIDLSQSLFEFREGAFFNAGTVTGQKALLSNYAVMDLIQSNADGNPLTQANFPGDYPIGYPDGDSTVTVSDSGFINTTGCLFSDLQEARYEQIGLRRLILDCTTGTAGATAAGGGSIAAWVWNADGTYWRVLSQFTAVPSSPVSQFLSRVSGLSATEMGAYVDLINGLVSDGVWDLITILYIFTTNTLASALQNLKSPDYTATVHGTLTFTADDGLQGDGATGYLDTGFPPKTAGGNFLQDWAGAGLYDLTSRTTLSNTYEMGTEDVNYDLVLSPRNNASGGGLIYGL